ncbi:MAG: hypothetical protein SFU53_03490 [Terrimicrobiaceae bacterium]|nr:hypothetical protein [Terrimicrobiaceae bacterium]
MNSLISADTLQEACSHCYWSDATAEWGGNMDFPGGSVVFCKIDEVMRFFEKLRLTRRRIILVTGEGDLPCDDFRQKFLPPQVERWFATNVTAQHLRVEAVPLGLGPATDSVTVDVNDFTKEAFESRERDAWLLVNFRPETNPGVRRPVFDHFRMLAAKSNWITFQEPPPPGVKSNFAQELRRHRFVLCPPGNGVDTHRLWESLAAGAVPIVLRSVAMEPFEDLPIVWVDRFEDVNFELLEASWPHAHAGNLEKLYGDYWLTRLQKAAESVRSAPMLSGGHWIRESVRYAAGMVVRRLRVG